MTARPVRVDIDPDSLPAESAYYEHDTGLRPSVRDRIPRWVRRAMADAAGMSDEDRERLYSTRIRYHIG